MDDASTMKDYCTRETAEALKRLGLDQEEYEGCWVVDVNGIAKYLKFGSYDFENDYDFTGSHVPEVYAAPSAGEALDKLPYRIVKGDETYHFEFNRFEDKYSIRYAITTFTETDHVGGLLDELVDWIDTPYMECLAEAACLMLVKLMEEAIL